MVDSMSARTARRSRARGVPSLSSSTTRRTMMDSGFRVAFLRRLIICGVAVTAIASPLSSQAPRAKTGDDSQASVPALSTIINRTSSELADVVERFSADQQSLGRRYDANESPDQRRRMRDFYSGWRTRLGEAELRQARAGRPHRLRAARQLSAAPDRAPRPPRKNARRDGRRCCPLPTGCSRCRTRGASLSPIDPRSAARTLATVTKQVDSLRGLFEAPAGGRRWRRRRHAGRRHGASARHCRRASRRP